MPQDDDPESLARARAARIEARIQGIPAMARRAGPRGVEYAHAIDEDQLRADGYADVEIEAYLKYKKAILDYYRRHPDGGE